MSEEERAREVLRRHTPEGAGFMIDGNDEDAIVRAMLAFAKEQPVTVAALYGYEAGLAARDVGDKLPS